MDFTILPSFNSDTSYIVCQHIVYLKKPIIPTSNLKVYNIFVPPLLALRKEKSKTDLITLLDDKTKKEIESCIDEKKKLIVLYDEGLNDSPFLSRFVEYYRDNIAFIFKNMDEFDEKFPENRKEINFGDSPFGSPVESPIIGYDPAPTQILEDDGWKLFLSSESIADDPSQVEKFNIKAIITVRFNPCELTKKGEEFNIRFFHIPINDRNDVNIKEYFENAVKFINDARDEKLSVLVHCHAGISRSATIILAYLMINEKISLGEAFKYVQSKRQIISPNLNFMGQLMALNRELGFDFNINEVM